MMKIERMVLIVFLMMVLIAGAVNAVALTKEDTDRASVLYFMKDGQVTPAYLQPNGQYNVNKDATTEQLKDPVYRNYPQNTPRVFYNNPNTVMSTTQVTFNNYQPTQLINYDDKHHPTYTVDYNANGVVTTEKTYDASGRELTRTDWANNVPTSHVYQYINGQQKEIRLTSGTTTTENSYNSQGVKISTTVTETVSPTQIKVIKTTFASGTGAKTSETITTTTTAASGNIQETKTTTYGTDGTTPASITSTRVEYETDGKTIKTRTDRQSQYTDGAESSSTETKYNYVGGVLNKKVETVKNNADLITPLVITTSYNANGAFTGTTRMIGTQEIQPGVGLNTMKIKEGDKWKTVDCTKDPDKSKAYCSGAVRNALIQAAGGTGFEFSSPTVNLFKNFAGNLRQLEAAIYTGDQLWDNLVCSVLDTEEKRAKCRSNCGWAVFEEGVMAEVAEAVCNFTNNVRTGNWFPMSEAYQKDFGYLLGVDKQPTLSQACMSNINSNYGSVSLADLSGQPVACVDVGCTQVGVYVSGEMTDPAFTDYADNSKHKRVYKLSGKVSAVTQKVEFYISLLNRDGSTISCGAGASGKISADISLDVGESKKIEHASGDGIYARLISVESCDYDTACIVFKSGSAQYMTSYVQIDGNNAICAKILMNHLSDQDVLDADKGEVATGGAAEWFRKTFFEERPVSPPGDEGDEGDDEEDDGNADTDMCDPGQTPPCS